MPNDMLHVCFTMDCESTTDGWVTSWELSKNAILGYCSVVREYGFSGTLFAVPEAARALADLFLAMEEEMGFEVALHLHPSRYAATEWIDGIEGEFGSLDESKQAYILELATEAWTEAMGKPPISFRPGSFSMSECSFRVLHSLGFRQGSVSLPGRFAPHYAVDWRGAERFPHHASPDSLLGSGTLEFFEVPCSAVQGDIMPRSVDPRHIRIEAADGDFHKRTVDLILEDLLESDPEVKTIVVLTHANFPYSDPSAEIRGRLRHIAEHIRFRAEKMGFRPKGATISSIHAWTDEFYGDVKA